MACSAADGTQPTRPQKAARPLVFALIVVLIMSLLPAIVLIEPQPGDAVGFGGCHF